MSPTPPQQPTAGPVDAEAIAEALAGPPEKVGIVSLVGLAVDQGKTLLTTQVELLKLKAGQAAKKFGAGAGFAIVALILVFYLIFWIFRTVEMLFLLIVPAWAAALITAGILLLLIILLLSIAGLLIKKATKDVPDVPEQIQSDVDAVKEGFSK